jgi:pimeloyl-ACP methyl ester carboxylesterase
VTPTGVVFVANGAGDYRTLTENLTRVVDEANAPLQVETLDWSKGYRRNIADQVDHENHLEQGRRLATFVDAYRRANPHGRVYLMGHSAGCAVILAAAELLPPGSVNRIILLAPSVCASYDLRPALNTSCDGIDVFYSRRDRLVLGLGMQIVGTTERGCRTAAGLEGFTPIVSTPADAAAYGKLRQHAWDPAVAWSGNNGGHFGDIQPSFLKAYVLPMMDAAP